MDVGRYVGIPYVHGGRDFSGVDCYGLVYLVYREEFGIVLPRYDGVPDEKEWHEVAVALANEAKSSGRWQPTDHFREGDVVEFKILKAPHIGIYVPEQRVLHCREGSNACIESLQSRRLRRRVNGCFRLAN